MPDAPDDEIDGEEEPCGHEADADADGQAAAPTPGEPAPITALRELLPYMEPIQHKSPDSGTTQANAVKAHAAVCGAIIAICNWIKGECDAGTDPR